MNPPALRFLIGLHRNPRMVGSGQNYVGILQEIWSFYTLFFLYRIKFIQTQRLLNLKLISLSNKNTGILLLGLKLQQLTISTSQLR